MRKDKLFNIVNKHHLFTNYEYDTTMGQDNKVVRTQHKTWTFTEDQLKSFVKDIEKETMSKYEII